jgi:hypothetical protein
MQMISLFLDFSFLLSRGWANVLSPDNREKTEIGGGMGYSGLFRDTEGNINGVWSQK